jgi:hypothetical protein
MTKWQHVIIGGSKRHIGNIKCDKLNMKVFLFLTIKGIKTLRMEGVRYNVGRYQKIHKGGCGH